MEDYLSTNWQLRQNETIDIYRVRILIQMKKWQEDIKTHGNIYLIKFNEGDIRPLQEDQISVPELVNSMKSPALAPYDCPLCQPYDYFDIQLGQYIQRRYLTKIVHPRYPEGFIDKVGVWQKCPCILKGEDRKYLRFKNMRGVI